MTSCTSREPVPVESPEDVPPGHVRLRSGQVVSAELAAQVLPPPRGAEASLREREARAAAPAAAVSTSPCSCSHAQVEELLAALAEERESRLAAERAQAFAEGVAEGYRQALAHVLEGRAATSPALRALPAAPPASPSLVYFIQAGHDGPIKIGRSRSPLTRLQELQTGNAMQLRYCGAVEGGAALEQALHEHFASIRLTGEWFTPTPELVDYIHYMLAADRAMRTER